MRPRAPAPPHGARKRGRAARGRRGKRGRARSGRRLHRLAAGLAAGTLAAPGWDGPGDQYLLLSADGGSQNGSLVTFNQAQWAGDYLAENVVAIAIDVNNFSAETLHRRLALGDGIAPRLGGTWYASDLPIDLPPGSGWMEAV